MESTVGPMNIPTTVPYTVGTTTQNIEGLMGTFRDLNNKTQLRLESETEKKEMRRVVAAKNFERMVVAGKIIVLIILLILAFVNADSSFIAQKPKNFLGECMAIGGSAAIATTIIGAGRFAPRIDILNAMLIAFLIFFIFHILMEFSGFNKEAGGELDNPDLTEEAKQRLKAKDEEREHVRWLTKSIVSGIALFGMVYAGTLAYQVNDWTNFKDSKVTKLKYLMELISFAFLGGIPFYLVAKDRDTDNNKAWVNTGITMGMYGTGYLILQAGGFFSHVFGEMPADASFFKPGSRKEFFHDIRDTSRAVASTVRQKFNRTPVPM